MLVKVESGNDWELGLNFGGDIGSRDGISVGKDIKSGVNVGINDSLCWFIDRSVDGWVCKCV